MRHDASFSSARRWTLSSSVHTGGFSAVPTQVRLSVMTVSAAAVVGVVLLEKSATLCAKSRKKTHIQPQL